MRLGALLSALRATAAHASSSFEPSVWGGPPQQNAESRRHVVDEPVDAVIRRLETSTGEGVVPEAALDLLRGMCSDPPEVGECAVCFDFLAHPVLTHCNHVYCMSV